MKKKTGIKNFRNDFECQISEYGKKREYLGPVWPADDKYSLLFDQYSFIFNIHLYLIWH